MPTPTDPHLHTAQQEAELLGKPPGWGLHWGNTVVLALLLSFLLAAWLIQYPDVVEAPVILSTQQPPVRVAPSAAGSLAQIEAKEGDSVAAGQVMAIFQNTAQVQDIQALERWVWAADSLHNPALCLSLQAPSGWVLGELQARYASLQASLADLQYWLSRQLKGQGKQQLALQAPRLNQMNAALERELLSLEKELKIADSLYNRTLSIFKNGSASRTELDQAQTNLLQTERQLERTRRELSANLIQQERLTLEQIQLGENLSDQAQEAWLSLKNNLRQLRAELTQWQQRYLITAPIAGIVTWPAPLAVNQYIAAGQAIMAITPTGGPHHIIARGSLNANASGKVSEGNQARIRLDAYPHREFGVLPAQVSVIALVSTADSNTPSYRLELELTQQMQSTYRKKLVFRQEMSGTARILTAERSLLERLFDRLRDVHYNQ